MAAVDPYAPCPCGSGQKFKWCCQKVEEYADRAERLLDNGQVESALAALDQGLRKVPDNPWLLTRKALIQLQQGQAEPARGLLERVVAKQPAHLGAHSLLVRVVLEAEGGLAGVAQLQGAITAVPAEQRGALAPMFTLVGAFLAEAGDLPAGRKHLELALRLRPDDAMAESALRMVVANAAASPWLRNPYELAPAPEGLAGPARERFEQALRWADEGLWSSAAAGFDTLAADRLTEAERNLGLCRLWLADHAGAVEALRRFIAAAGETTDAVDLEALCQLVAPPREDDLVEHVHLIWPLKSRDQLLAALQASDRVDPEDPDSFEVDQFALLDRPKVGAGSIARAEDLPRVLGRVLVAREIVLLDLFDDGRLDDLVGRFTELAGPAIPPAHPKTKVLEKVPRAAVALQPEWWVPEGTPRSEMTRLGRLERARVARDVWPATPQPYLGGRTPRQAARDGNARVPLRAAVAMLELTHNYQRDEIDFTALRSELRIPDEPPIDPETMDVARVHLGRLHRVPAERLDDDRLVALRERARAAILPLAMERAARAVIERPAVMDRPEVGHVHPYTDLANLALSRGDASEAFEWLSRGRRAEPAALRTRNAVRWDLAEVRLRARHDAPEAWVPQLAVVLDRYREDAAAGEVILTALMDMGLVQLAPHPDNPDQLLLDSRPLQAVMARYGPRVTTAAGQLGVSATQGGIWTPGGSTAGGGGIWTPGSPAGPAPGGDKPKLIIPGR